MNKITFHPVIERIQVAAHRLDLNEVTAEQKRHLGELIAKTFFESPKHLYVRKEKIHEKEGEVEVWVYPNHFVPVMDKIIFDYLRKSDVKETQPSQEPEPLPQVQSEPENEAPPEKKRRKRTSVKAE